MWGAECFRMLVTRAAKLVKNVLLKIVWQL